MDYILCWRAGELGGKRSGMKTHCVNNTVGNIASLYEKEHFRLEVKIVYSILREYFIRVGFNVPLFFPNYPFASIHVAGRYSH